MSILEILLIGIGLILLLNIKMGVYRNRARRINCDGIGSGNKWYRVARRRP